MLDRVRAADTADPKLAGLLAEETFASEIANARVPWREVSASAVRRGIPTPAFSAALIQSTGRSFWASRGEIAGVLQRVRRTPTRLPGGISTDSSSSWRIRGSSTRTTAGSCAPCSAPPTTAG
ncbi:hypothetical protein [Streptomyces narbonensis]|uniref:hypothetical protein n=1 Tax=Streptomyces narbonensis TaxID=67333 RepID=UPI00351AA5FF